MGSVTRIITGVGERRTVIGLGVLHVAVALGFVAMPVVDMPVGDTVVETILVGGSGIALAYGGYRLPATDIRPDLYHIVGTWCLRAIGVMLGIAALGSIVGGVDEPVGAFVVLPALASVAGLGMGYHDARARTRAVDAEERRREAEQYSRELERYQTIVETVNDGIFVIDEENRFTLVNDAYTELVGYEREELLGSNSAFLATGDTDVEAMSDTIHEDLGSGLAGRQTYESKIQTASGETREVESTVALLPEQEGADRDKVVVVRDITERNERERRLEKQNERLDSFAGLVAHELRNPVTIGQIYSQQLPSDGDRKATEYITEAFDRIEHIIDVMLVITRGRKAVSESESVELADVVRETWDEADSSGATLSVAVDRAIEADETYVRHLFRNLFENAVEHGGSDVTVTVGDLPTGFYVEDDGTGIPKDDREVVFGSGYTTAGGRGGMGLGLTFVREMADIYGWTCSVTESESGGARFEFENVTET
ncbi:MULTISPECIES: PAS domain S-box protein [Halorussus]|uniref:PAS domain S-box protein n=1 Tax=Halorussus TaxID=1070314 RepID=UPI00209ED960|nr:PAS domain S-box protein [Halorussus vallis]USZ73926.1 PAS domain S-box protein [Halorussus vallis]